VTCSILVLYHRGPRGRRSHVVSISVRRSSRRQFATGTHGRHRAQVKATTAPRSPRLLSIDHPHHNHEHIEMPWENVKLNDGAHASVRRAPRPLTRGSQGTRSRPSRSVRASPARAHYRACFSRFAGTWKIGNGDSTIENVKTAVKVGFTHVGASCAAPPACPRRSRSCFLARQTRRRATGTRSRRARRSARSHATRSSSPPNTPARTGSTFRRASTTRSRTCVRFFHDLHTSAHQDWVSWARATSTCTSSTRRSLRARISRLPGRKWRPSRPPGAFTYPLFHRHLLIARIRTCSLARSIGVSNFDDRDLAELLEHAKIAPAANQVLPFSSTFVRGS
jgi:hypothetical protein